MSELEIRLKNDGAIKRCGKVFCSVHGAIELTKDGSCVECERTDRIIGAEVAEAKAQRAFDRWMESR